VESLVRSILLASAALTVATAAHADLLISAKPSHDVSCVSGVCTATAKNANLNVSELESLLADGDATVRFGGGASAIQVVNGFSWGSTSLLTLDANTSVGFHKPVFVNGGGAFSLIYDDGGTTGDLKFSDQGRIDFLSPASSRLTINGNSYVLLTNIKSLAKSVANNPRGLFALAQDYDAAADGKYKASPISAAVGGIVEGLGHAVRNLKISSSNSAATAFIANILAGGAVRDLAITDARISSKGGDNNVAVVGSLAGTNNGALVGISSSGSLTVQGAVPTESVGGLAGMVGGLVERSSSTMRVYVRGPEGGVYGTVGGLAGYVTETALIDHSFESGPVTAVGITEVGGLVGENHGTISFSHAAGAASSSIQWVGGLVGVNSSGILTNDYATGTVTVGGGVASPCGFAAGGLVGVSGNFSSKSYVHVIDDSYATGSVIGGPSSCIGGLVGDYYGRFISSTNSYSVGALSRGGGIAGYGRDLRRAVFQSMYWDRDTSGTDWAFGNKHGEGGVKGLTDAQLKSGLPEGFDPNIWGSNPNINNGYPYLLANPPQ